MKAFYFMLFGFILAEANTIVIKAGTYTLPAQKSFYTDVQSQEIKVKTFKIDKYEVSNSRFGKKIEFEDELQFPVVSLSYEDAEGFCKKMGGHLPTVAQWVVSSSFENGKFYGFATQKYPITDEKNINVIDERASELEKTGYGAFNDLVDVEDALVGNNKIVGMCGNVWEMTRSSGEYVVLKGASFYNSESIDMMDTRVENRVLKSSLKEYEHIGFRCVYEK